VKKKIQMMTDFAWDSNVLLADTTSQPAGAAVFESPPEMLMTEEELMKLSNKALQDESSKQNQSTNGNKTVMVQRLLARATKRILGERAVPEIETFLRREKIMWKNLLVF
jgi:hypothetical protein